MTPEKTVEQKSSEYLTVEQVAAKFGVKRRCIARWMANGLIPYYRIGRTIRFSPDALKSHLEKTCACGPNARNN